MRVIEYEEELIVREQLELSVLMPKAPDLKELWNNSVIQFGYIAFFSLAFPAAPFWGIIICFLHFNLTFYSLGTQTQRPLCLERDSIGIWKHIFFVYSLIALAINAGLLLFTSKGVYLLLDFDTTSSYDMYQVAVILAIAENIIFVLKYLVAVVIPDTPSWVHTELEARRVRRNIQEEKSRIKHFKIKEEIKEHRQSLMSMPANENSGIGLPPAKMVGGLAAKSALKNSQFASEQNSRTGSEEQLENSGLAQNRGPLQHKVNAFILPEKNL